MRLSHLTGVSTIDETLLGEWNYCPLPPAVDPELVLSGDCKDLIYCEIDHPKEGRFIILGYSWQHPGGGRGVHSGRCYCDIKHIIRWQYK